MSKKRYSLYFRSISIGLAALVWVVAFAVAATQTDIVGPPGSGKFGMGVTVLPNGNIVVSDPSYDAGSVADVGAVYLYNGATGALISTLTGSTTGDQIGVVGVTVLANGNYLVINFLWDNGAAVDAGAVTWGSATTGVSGAVSPANSLVGSTAGDKVGSYDVTGLANGNYVVCTPFWDNGAAMDAGAVTWGSGTTGVRGAISPANSLVGSTADDKVGYHGVTELANGNYLVITYEWDNSAAVDAGAATWGSGTIGVSGAVSAANSLVGSTTGDQVGASGVVALANSNYVVRSSFWDNGAAVDAGAATWGSGTIGITGAVSAANSLVGSTTGDGVGSSDVVALANGNYVMASFAWDNGAAVDAGAVTWGSGTTGVRGAISPANSLVGSTAGDSVGASGVGVVALANGNYVVASQSWDNGVVVDAGAVTWGSGTTGISGAVSAANSLVGSAAGDQVGIQWVRALANGNYVVSSPFWDNGAAVDAGAATWGSGTTGITGAVSAANSLVGSTTNDRVGIFVRALVNGNYVVTSYFWVNGAAMDAGAVTWGSGMTGVSGTVSAANSLLGNTSNDLVGLFVIYLANGNYVVESSGWDNGAVVDAGAATWGSGTTGVSGAVSAANSLVGSTAGDSVGGVLALANGNYVVGSAVWDNGAAVDAGAVTWGSGTTGISGAVSAANSLVGSTTGDQVGGVQPLANGNYVVISSHWDNGVVGDAGAVTWGSGTTGINGAVSAANSLVGSTAGDQVGNQGVMALVNGNYVVFSSGWDNGAVVDAGAATWGSGTTGVSGAVNAANSLVGSTAGDQVGGAFALANGNYVVWSPSWDNGAAVDAGAITLGNGSAGNTIGPINADNSVPGSTAGGGVSLQWAFDDIYSQLVVGRPGDNIVTLYTVGQKKTVFLPIMSR